MSSLVLHAGPGAIITFAGLVISSQASRCTLVLNRDREGKVKAVLALLFAPLLVLEIATDPVLDIPSMQHIMLYTLILGEGVLHYLCYVRNSLPKGICPVYESILFLSIGLVFTAHNHGAPIYMQFHKFLAPMLALVAVLALLVGVRSPYPAMQPVVLPSGKRAEIRQDETLLLALGIALQLAGNWTSTIGFAFFFYGEHKGLLASEDPLPDTTTAAELAEATATATAQLVVYLTEHIIVAIATTVIQHYVLRGLGLTLEGAVPVNDSITHAEAIGSSTAIETGEQTDENGGPVEFTTIGKKQGYSPLTLRSPGRSSKIAV